MTTPPPPPPGDAYGSYPSGDGGLVLPATDDDKTMGMIAHAGGIFLGFLAPLLIMLIKKDSAFAQQEAKEALNFQILVAIAYVVSAVLVIVVIGFCLMAAIWIAVLVFGIMGAMKVNEGQPYRYPINMRIIK